MMLLIILRISLQLNDMYINQRLLKYLFAIIRQPLWKQTKRRWMNEIKSSDNENNPVRMMNHELFLQKDWSTKGVKPFFEPRPLSRNLSLGFVDWICAVLLTILAINFFYENNLLFKSWYYPKFSSPSSNTFDALRDLVPFAQFKKPEKHPWRSVTFSNVAG